MPARKLSDVLLMELVNKGLNDCQIAALTGVQSSAVCRRRKRAGLVTNFTPEPPRVAMAANRERTGALASRYGLDHRPAREVVVLLSLLDGALTRLQLMARIGGSAGYLKEVLQSLANEGLVIRAGTTTGATSRARRTVYMLTLKALEVFCADKGNHDGTP